MRSDAASFGRYDRPRYPRQITRQKFAKRPLPDEADAGRVLFRPRRNAFPSRDRTNVAFFHRAERKHRGRELRLRQAMEEVALILGFIERFEKLDARTAIRGGPHARIVPRRNGIRAERQRMIEKRAKLDFAVAQDIGIRRSAGFVFAQKLCENARAVFGGEVDRLQIDADDIGHGSGVDQILARRAVFVGVVVLPILHEHADDFEALLLQQPRRDRGIDTPRHPHDHTLAPLHQLSASV